MNLCFAGALEFKVCFFFQIFWLYLHTLKFKISKSVHIVFSCISIRSQYNLFTVKSHTIKGCMGREKLGYCTVFHGNGDLNYWQGWGKKISDHPSPITKDVNIFGKFGIALNVKLKLRNCSHYMTARAWGWGGEWFVLGLG